VYSLVTPYHKALEQAYRDYEGTGYKKAQAVGHQLETTKASHTVAVTSLQNALDAFSSVTTANGYSHTGLKSTDVGTGEYTASYGKYSGSCVKKSDN